MNHVSRHSNENMEELFEAILSLRDMEECRAFFSDLCTMQELMLLSQRLQVAKQFHHHPDQYGAAIGLRRLPGGAQPAGGRGGRS